jgi:hypothetical protein
MTVDQLLAQQQKQQQQEQQPAPNYKIQPEYGIASQLSHSLPRVKYVSVAPLLYSYKDHLARSALKIVTS